MRPHRRERGPDGARPRDIADRQGVDERHALKVRFIGGTPAEQATAREQAAWWQRPATSASTSATHPDADIRITFDPNDGAWSYVGTDCKSIPADEATMNLGFLDGGTAGHEFGHAIGLAHEHSNPEGGIQWNEPVVIAALGGPPNFWDEAEGAPQRLHEVRGRPDQGHAVRPRLDHALRLPGVVDPQRDRDARERRAVEARQGLRLRGRDVSAVGARSSPTPPRSSSTAPKVSGSIGAPGEEDLYAFDVRPTGSTRCRRAGRPTSSSRSTARTARRPSSPRTTTAATAATRRSAGPDARSLPRAGAALLAGAGPAPTRSGCGRRSGCRRHGAGARPGRSAGRMPRTSGGIRPRRTPLTLACNRVILIT